MGLFRSKKKQHKVIVEYDAYREKTIMFELYVFASGDVEEVAYCVENSDIPQRLDRPRVLRDFDGNKVAEITMRNVTCVIPREKTTVNERYRNRKSSGWFTDHDQLDEWVEKQVDEHKNVKIVGTTRRLR